MDTITRPIFSSPAWTTKRQYRWRLRELGSVTGYGKGILSLQGNRLIFTLDDETTYLDLLTSEIKTVEFVTGNTLKIKTTTDKSYKMALFDANEASSYASAFGVQVRIIAGANDVTEKWIAVLQSVVTVSTKGRTDMWKYVIRSMVVGAVLFAMVCALLVYYLALNG